MGLLGFERLPIREKTREKRLVFFVMIDKN